MKDIFLKEIEEKLEEKKRSIENDLKGFAKKDKKVKNDWDTGYPKFEQSGSNVEDAADEVEEYANLLPVEHSLELKLVDVKIALDKIKKGKYGICEQCNKKISKERLDASPEARKCLDCTK
jgi:DnaK suppressor protein